MQGAHADDLPPAEAGLLVIAERVRCASGERYGTPAARWIDLHIWETDPLHHVIRAWHSDHGTGAPDVPPPTEATR